MKIEIRDGEDPKRGVLTFEANPKSENVIEAKDEAVQPKTSRQPWTTDRVDKIISEHGPEGLVKIINVELLAEKQKADDAIRFSRVSQKKLRPAIDALMEIAEDTVIDHKTSEEEPSLAAIMAGDFLEDLGWSYNEDDKTWKFNEQPYVPGLPDRSGRIW
jgi:hypothetical protein